MAGSGARRTLRAAAQEMTRPGDDARPLRQLRVVNELSRPGATVSLVARRNDINSSLLFKWRRLAREGVFGALPDDHGFVPVRLASASAKLVVAPVAADEATGSGLERDEPGCRDHVTERLPAAGSGGNRGVVSASAGDGAEDGGLICRSPWPPARRSGWRWRPSTCARAMMAWRRRYSRSCSATRSPDSCSCFAASVATG